MDGMRFNAIVKNNQVEFRSRNGKLIDIPYGVFDAPFLALADHYKCEMVFDGELLVADENELPLDRKTGNGILNKAVKGTMSGTEAKRIRATLWDAIPFSEFEKEKSDEPYQHRFAKLDNAISHVKNNYPNFIHDLVKLIWHKQVSSLEEARSIFEKFLGDGQEGIILKTRNGVWENKRAKHQIKFKGEYECDLLCVGWEEGTGKNVGRLGALLLESSCGQLKVGVGSGLTDDDRNNIGKDVVGKIIAIKYNAIVDDKQTNIKSLFLPIFLEVREDKQTADILSSLKG
jgi:ATP-dependent DNA ligase